MVKVSVVMPAYNAENFISEAIDSILNQTFTDFEFIIINDGSTDRTIDIIKSYSDNRIVIVENEQNMGIVHSLNKGLEYAQGKYIARMDADDFSVKNRLEKQVKYMDEHPNIAVLGTSIKIFGDNIRDRVVDYATDSDMIKVNLLFHSCFAHPSVMIRKQVLDEFNLKYDSQYQGREDYKLWWDISQVSNLTSLNEVLLYYRIHNSQVTKNKNLKSKENSKLFLKKRLADINVVLEKKQEIMLLKYCIGDINNLNYNQILDLVYANATIIKMNEKNKTFKQSFLRQICSLCINYTIKQSDISKIGRVKILWLSNRMNIHTAKMIIKSLKIVL